MSKVCLFINSLKSGGAERQLCLLASLLADNSIDVCLVTISNSKDHYICSDKVKRKSICRDIDPRFIKVIKVFLFFFFFKGDCIISYCQRNNYYLLKSLSFRHNRPHVICSERNFKNSPGKYERQLYYSLYPRYADYIVSNSFSQQKYITERQPLLKSRVLTIINYLDLNYFTPKDHLYSDCLKILVTARIDRQKNCLRFIEAVAVLKKYAKKRFRVSWYGNQSFENEASVKYVREVKELIRDKGVEDIFTLYDPVSNVKDIIYSHDVMCLPSLFEGFSNSIAEGIACGKPMIVSNVSDNPIMVRTGKNGFLFDPMDIDSMVDAFNALFSLSPHQMDAMGRNSRLIAEDLFSKENFTQSYISLIKK